MATLPRTPNGHALALLMLTLTACAGTTSAPSRSTVRSSGALVIEGEALRSINGRLLDAMRGRVSTMQVIRGGSGCPQVILRGARTIYGSTAPEVYVDGTRMVDTCILDQLRSAEVERVEVYAGAAAAGAGYATSSNGLIAVFLLDGVL